MKDKKTYRLLPNEYIVTSEIIANIMPEWKVGHGLLITKGEEKIPVETILPVDPGCEIEVTVDDNNKGKVKYIKSTGKRIYYNSLILTSVLLEVISIIFVVYEIAINNNYAVKGSSTYNLLLPALSSWFCLLIPLLRNAKGFTKWALTIFAYILLVFNITYFILYLITLFS